MFSYVQQKYEEAVASLAQMENRAVMAGTSNGAMLFFFSLAHTALLI
jgi:hypothetical protein